MHDKMFYNFKVLLFVSYISLKEPSMVFVLSDYFYV